MLSLYDSFNVPEVPHVTIYRDDERPHKFYMVSERATIARDEEGKPLFTFVLYARDAERLAPEDREVERGYIAISTQAGVTQQEEQKIRTFLRQKLSREQGHFFLDVPINRPEPELSYPPLWLDGTVEFRAVPDDMVPLQVGSKQPSLINSNLASFSASLNQDGAEFFRQTVEQGRNVSGVWYTLSFAARIPAIKIRVTGNKGEFYNEVKNYVRKRREVIRTRKVLGITYSRSHYIHEWDELSSITKFRHSFQGLTITVDDMGLPGSSSDAQEMNKKLEDMAFTIVQTNILPTFFGPAIEEVAQEDDEGNPPPNPHTSIPINEVTTGTIDLTFSRSQMVEKKVNPSGVFSQILTPEELKAATAYVDLSNSFFQELDVRVNANVNFEADPVFGLKVFLDYDQQDEIRRVRVKRAKEILFKSADQIGRFRQIMAKGRDGAPKDSYRYWSELIYKDTGETIRVPAQGAIEARDRELTISYRRLGFIKVNLTLGAMPDEVQGVQVKMVYPGVTRPSANQSFELSRDKPTATFFTYTGKTTGEPGPYQYQFTYLLADGQRMDLPKQSGHAELLTIPNPFEQQTTTRFLAQADFSIVEKILVDAKYVDEPNDLVDEHHAELMSNGETSPWAISLRNTELLDIEYRVIIINRDGSREEQTAKKAKVGDTIPVGAGAVDALEVKIIPSLLDWGKYRMVLLFLQYTDQANDLKKEKSFSFRPENSSEDQEWKVLLRNKDMREYMVKKRYIGFDSADNRETGWEPTIDPILVLE